ncbi:hypothetical protein SAMN05421823_1302 [Catalinimonas alkaloidigena]|uniref:Uncharacterized protein n=1 Tax=Catalinimonas alkaloidigena TaxID=1075417 RepID=A0A1G9W2D9_9BACT|nr:hypothetical protein SAMN05421823_1302 [Catalinimonas alkaloidigena]
MNPYFVHFCFGYQSHLLVLKETCIQRSCNSSTYQSHLLVLKALPLLLFAACFAGINRTCWY